MKKMLLAVLCCLALAGAAWAEEPQPAPTPTAPAPAAAFPHQTIDVQIGGGGVVGAVLRRNLSDRFSAGLGVMLRPTAVTNEANDKTTAYLGVFFPVECTFWTPGKGGDKGPNRHGLGLMAGVGAGAFSEFGAGVYYDYDRLTKSGHVYTASVGVAYFAPTSLPDNMQATTSAAIFWRFAWGWGI